MPIDATVQAALPFFARLSATQRRALSQVLADRRFAPGAVIFEEGDPGLSCGFIVTGTVHAEVDAGPGRPRERINSMGPGEIFGEIALLDGGHRSATCVAGEDGARVAMLSRADFGQLFEAGNPFAFSMVRLVARQLARRLQHAARVWSEVARADADGD